MAKTGDLRSGGSVGSIDTFPVYNEVYTAYICVKTYVHSEFFTCKKRSSLINFLVKMSNKIVNVYDILRFFLRSKKMCETGFSSTSFLIKFILLQYTKIALNQKSNHQLVFLYIIWQLVFSENIM